MAEFSLGTAALGTAIDLTGLRSGQDVAHKETEGWLSSLQGTAQRGFGGLQKAVGVGLLGGLGVVTAGFAGLAAVFKGSEADARESINIQKQLSAVLESTGGAAGISADEVNALAGSLQKVTNFDAEATLTGQNLLLTFTNIGENVFPRATETMLDMAQALGTDAKGSAIQLGKALNDPIAGIGALSRVGVSFTEQQKEQIKTMVEAGDVAGAQGVILDELAKEFGGSARALADPAIQMANAFGDLKETVGGVIVQVKNELAVKALPVLGKATELATSLIGNFTESIGQGFGPISAFKQALLGTFGSIVPPVIYFIDNIVSAIDILKNLFTEVTFFEETPRYFLPFAKIGDALRPTIQDIGRAITSFISWKDVMIATGLVVASIVLPFLWGLVAAAAPIIAVAAALIAGVALLRTAWENDWGGIQELVGGVVSSITGAYQGFIDGTLTLPEAIGQAFSGIGAAIAERLPGWIATLQGWATAAWQWIVDSVPVVLGKLGEWATSLIGGLAAGLPGFLAGIYEWAAAIVDWIGEAIPNAIDNLTRFIESLGSEGDAGGENTFVPMVARWVGLLIDWVVNDLVPKVGPAFLSFLGSLAEAMLNIAIALGKLALTIGEAIIGGIVDGLNAGAQLVKDAALNAARAAWEAAKDFLGISSPSKLFERMGSQTAQGFADGIANNARAVLSEMDSLMGSVSISSSLALPSMGRAMQPVYTGQTAYGGGAGVGQPSNIFNIAITVPAGATEQDGQRAARGFLSEMRAAGLR